MQIHQGTIWAKVLPRRQQRLTTRARPKLLRGRSRVRSTRLTVRRSTANRKAYTARSQQSSQYTPYGSQVYSADPSSPSGYRSNITLAPEAQRTLDSQLGISENLGNLTEAQLGRVNRQYTQPMDLSSVPDIENRAD